MQLVKRTPEEIEYAFETFVEKVQDKINDHFVSNYKNLKAPKITVHPGRVYWKVVREEGEDLGINCSVYGFVRKSDGAIFKAATWKAPYTKGNSAIRGYVCDNSNGMDATTAYSIKYAS
jgi:hypothetical protein